eukprot:6012031-Alexandrium_andersonii.AAC.1
MGTVCTARVRLLGPGGACLTSRGRGRATICGSSLSREAGLERAHACTVLWPRRILSGPLGWWTGISRWCDTQLERCKKSAHAHTCP